MAWLPEVSASVMRRLQVLAAAAGVPCVVWRSSVARVQALAAPLRLQVWPEANWGLRVQVFKRRGPTMEGTLLLHAVPPALQSVLPEGREQGAAPLGTVVPLEVRGRVGRAMDVVRARHVVAGIATV